MKRKVGFILEVVIGTLFIALIATSFIVQACAPTSEFADFLRSYTLDTSNIEASLNTQLPVFIKSLLLIIGILAVCRIIRIILQKKKAKGDRAKTILTLLDGFVKYGCAIAVIILFLKACGVNTTALLASIGILTLVVGLGAQSLIADIIAGIFIVFENEYNAGEIVSIDDFRGTVIEIGIRSTKLKDTAGNIKIINNSNISNVVNMSRELSLAIVDCEFPYDVPLEFMEKLMKDNLEGIKERIPAIIEGPYYKGVSYYGESNVGIKLVAKCNEEDRYQVQRDILREYRMLIVEQGIDISYPQVVVQEHVDTNIKTTKNTKKEANLFAQQQQEISKNLEEQHD